MLFELFKTDLINKFCRYLCENKINTIGHTLSKKKKKQGRGCIKGVLTSMVKRLQIETR